MRKLFLTSAALLCAALLRGHVTPNVQLVRRGDFIQASLPGAVKFSEKILMIGGPDMAAIRKSTGWMPTEEDAKIYLGRDSTGRIVGSVTFVWMPSEHGPVGVGVAFDPQGRILRAEVTDVGTEPLAWVRPLLSDGLSNLKGLGPDDKASPSEIAPTVKGAMSRYYASVISDAVSRAQALERVSRATPASK